MRDFLAKSWWSSRSRQTTIQLLLLLSMSMLIVILFGAHGVRGTDQYWYLADVDTLIQGGEPLSNLYFPRVLIENREDTNYFIHNGPALHLSAIVGGWTGAFYGWLIVNLLCHLVTASCIYITALRCTNNNVATASCFLYFISPVAIWQTVNMLQENFFSALLAIIICSHTYIDKKYPKLILHIALALSIAIHPLFTTLTLTYIAIKLYNSIKRQNKKLLLESVFFSTICAAVYKLYPLVFPSNFQPDLYSLIAGSIPKLSNMIWHYSDSLPTLDLQLLTYKLRHAVQLHISQPHFYFYTLIALICSVYLLLRRKKPLNNIVYPLSFVMMLYVALCILMQSQPRYQQIFAPATFLLIALILYDLKKHLPASIKNSLFTILASASMTASIFLCYSVNLQSKNEQKSLAELTDQLRSLPSNSNILLQDSNHGTKLSYILKPRKILSVESNLLAANRYAETISEFQPDFVISTNPLQGSLGEKTSGAQLKTSHLGDFYIYKFNESFALASRDDQGAQKRTLLSQRPQQ